jgi:hypothetical protein
MELVSYGAHNWMDLYSGHVLKEMEVEDFKTVKELYEQIKPKKQR